MAKFTTIERVYENGRWHDALPEEIPVYDNKDAASAACRRFNSFLRSMGVKGKELVVRPIPERRNQHGEKAARG